MIAPDQHLVLVGLMGSGKSTVARLVAEFRLGERLRLHRAMAGPGARELRVVVRVLRQRAIAHAGALMQEVDHPRCFAEVGLDHFRGD